MSKVPTVVEHHLRDHMISIFQKAHNEYSYGQCKYQTRYEANSFEFPVFKQPADDLPVMSEEASTMIQQQNSKSSIDSSNYNELDALESSMNKMVIEPDFEFSVSSGYVSGNTTVKFQSNGKIKVNR